MVYQCLLGLLAYLVIYSFGYLCPCKLMTAVKLQCCQYGKAWLECEATRVM